MTSPAAVRRRRKPSAKRRSGDEVLQRLRDAASKEFGVSGYGRTKTATIAKQAGVSETLLFKYFGTKANLFNDTIFGPIERHFAEFNDSHAIGADAADERQDASKQYIAEMQAFIREHSEAIMLLIVSGAFEADDVRGIDKVSGLHRYFERTSEIVRSRAASQPRIDPRLIACISFATILSCEMFRGWLVPENWATDREMKEAVAEFVLGGLSFSVD